MGVDAGQFDTRGGIDRYTVRYDLRVDGEPYTVEATLGDALASAACDNLPRQFGYQAGMIVVLNVELVEGGPDCDGSGA